MTDALPERPASIEFATSAAVMSSRVAVISWAVVFITKAGDGETISFPVRLMSMLKAPGYSSTSPTRSVSHSRDTSAVRMAKTFPSTSLTGAQKVVINFSPPPVSK